MKTAIQTLFGIWCTRDGASVCGFAESWMKRNGERLEFDNIEEANNYVLNVERTMYSTKLFYEVKEI